MNSRSGRMRRHGQAARLADIFAYLDHPALTRVSQRPWAPRLANREWEIEQACWLRDGGSSFAQIADLIGVSERSARRYVEIAEPDLV